MLDAGEGRIRQPPRLCTQGVKSSRLGLVHRLKNEELCKSHEPHLSPEWYSRVHGKVRGPSRHLEVQK